MKYLRFAAKFSTAVIATALFLGAMTLGSIYNEVTHPVTLGLFGLIIPILLYACTFSWGLSPKQEQSDIPTKQLHVTTAELIELIESRKSNQ